jgi:hypothetical protein
MYKDIKEFNQFIEQCQPLDLKEGYKYELLAGWMGL